MNLIESLQNKYTTETLKFEDVQNYIDFFKDNILQLDVYSEAERERFINKRNFDYIRDKLNNENFIFLVVKNSKGQILAVVESEIMIDKVTSKKVGLVKWIIVGKNSKTEDRKSRMTLGKDLGEVLESELTRRNCDLLRVEIKDTNLVSLNFSKRFGFIPSAIKHQIEDMKWYYKKIK